MLFLLHPEKRTGRPSPSGPRVLPTSLRYLVLEPVLPEPELPEPVPLLLGVEEVPPAPEPVLLPAAPVPPGVVGDVGEEEVPPLDAAPPVLLPAAPVEPEELLPVVLLGEELLGEELLSPEELLPLVTLLSRRHLSRSAPIMPRHLLELELLLAPPEAESLLEEPALEEPVALGDDVLGDELDDVLGDDEAPDELLGADEAPDELLGDEVLPVALLLVSALLAPEDDDPVAELCATATPERASSAAAVAEQISFNVI